MLIDYISSQYLPWVIVWLDWNFYAYRVSFFLCLAVACFHHAFLIKEQTLPGLSLALFVGFCLWVVWCAIRHGYAVG